MKHKELEIKKKRDLDILFRLFESENTVINKVRDKNTNVP